MHVQLLVEGESRLQSEVFCRTKTGFLPEFPCNYFHLQYYKLLCISLLHKIPLKHIVLCSYHITKLKEKNKQTGEYEDICIVCMRPCFVLAH